MDQSARVVDVEIAVHPVIVDLAEASTPKGDIALRIAAEAAQQIHKLRASNKRTDVIRLLSTGRSEVFIVNPYLLKVKDDWNCRDLADAANIEHIDVTARSIAEIGVEQPLTVIVEGDSLFVADGHIRLLATMRAIEVHGAEIKGVPVQAEKLGVSEADRTLGQIVRNSGRPLSVLEMGTVFVKLTGFRWTPERIAARVGITPMRVNQVLDLVTKASPATRAMVADGRVSPTTAALALRYRDGDGVAAERLLNAAIRLATTRRDPQVMQRHVEAAARASGRVSRVSAIRAIFRAETTKVDTGLDDGQVVITMTGAHWHEMCRLVGM